MLESAISKKIIEWFKHPARGGWAVKNHGSAFTGRGEPDIHACLNKRMIVIETKVPVGGRLTEIQKHYLDKWAFAGAVAIVATSVDDMVQQLMDEGVTW